jgi:hypothetical protein
MTRSDLYWYLEQIRFMRMCEYHSFHENIQLTIIPTKVKDIVSLDINLLKQPYQSSNSLLTGPSFIIMLL